MDTENTLLPFEPLDVISCTTIFGVLNGVAFSLYFLCAWSLYLKFQNPDEQRRARLSLGYISFLSLCATALLALNTRVIQLAYIDHADFPGGPLAYEGPYSSGVNLYQTAGAVFQFTIEVSVMVIQIRRLWIIWSATQYAVVVTVLPVLLLLAYIALDIPASIVGDVVLLKIAGETAIAMETAVYIILSSFTALVTGLVGARLLFARRRLKKAMGMSGITSPYLSIVAVLVESYALESAWSLGAAISLALHNPSQILFSENDSMVKIIAYFLVVYRVEKGRGWTKQTGEKLTILQFNRASAQGTTNEASALWSQEPITAAILPVIVSSTIDHSTDSPL